MSAGYSVKPADANNQVWNVLDASGNQIGAFSSHEDALRIVALIKGSANVREEHDGGNPTTARNKIEESAKTVVQQTQELYQTSPQQRETVWSFIKKYYAFMCVTVRKIASRKT